MRDADGVIRQLEQEFASLSPQLQIAARYVLDAPNDIAMHSMRAVAERASVHPSTMVRLAKQLGFDGYATFRDSYRERLQHRAGTLTARAHRLRRRASSAPDASLFAELHDAATRNAELTLANTSPEALSAAAKRLHDSRRVYVVGMRKCFPVAYFIHYCCRMCRENVRLVSGFAGMLADDLRGISAEDTMVAIGYDPYTRETVLAAEDAAEHGAYVIAITDSSVSTIASHAQQVFVVSNGGPTFFRSVASAMTLAEALIAFLLAQGGEDSLGHLRDTERQLERYRTYWDEAAGLRGQA